jgi:hypothetical protein
MRRTCTRLVKMRVPALPHRIQLTFSASSPKLKAAHSIAGIPTDVSEHTRRKKKLVLFVESPPHTYDYPCLSLYFVMSVFPEADVAQLKRLGIRERTAIFALEVCTHICHICAQISADLCPSNVTETFRRLPNT